MRLRNIPRAQSVIEDNVYVINDPAAYKGRWQELFGNDRPIRVEIGMGKGQFLINMAKANPDVNYIGIEKYTSVLLRAVEKLPKEDVNRETIPNLYLICMMADDLADVFAEGELDRIYLNFSDPWPKDRHHKRRLTSREFLARYDKVLKAQGLLEFKTDNVGLFEFSLEEIPAAGWELLAHTRDLHHDPMGEGNIMTEYEERFSGMGNPICKLIARRG